MTDNKLVKTLIDAGILTGGISVLGYTAKKVLNKSFTADPSNSFENYAMFTLVMAGSLALKQYLEDQKILPNSV